KLVGLEADVIFAGGRPATEAAKNATRIIPIVTSSSDPVGAGLITGVAQPRGNITGLANFTFELVGKRLELLKEMMPQLSLVVVLWTPGSPGSDRRMREAEVAAQSLGVDLQAAVVRDRDDLETAFAAIKKHRAEALIT